VVILLWVFNRSSKSYRLYLLTSDFNRGGDMMIGNERRGDKSLHQLMYCRMVCLPAGGVVVGRQRSLGGGTVFTVTNLIGP